MLFFALLFQIQVSYGISVWGRTYHYLINGIQRVQNRAIRFTTYIKDVLYFHFERSTSLLHNVYKSFTLTLSNISLRKNFQFHYHNFCNGADIRNEIHNSTGLGTVPLLFSYVTNYNRVSRVLKADGKNEFKLQLKKAIRL
jgi:hypothetical protein